MLFRYSRFIILVIFFIDVFPRAAAERIDSCHRPVRSTSRVSETKCKEYTRGTTCNNSYDDIDPNVVEDAKLGEFPHLAFVAAEVSDSNKTYFVCTGSLISPRFVLTEAYCTTQWHAPLYVTLGGHSTDQTVVHGATPIQVPIKAIHRHSDNKRPVNDIALLELDAEIPSSVNIRPACLGTDGQTSGHDKAVIATIDLSIDEKYRKHVIQKISVTLKDDDTCNNAYSKYMFLQHGMDDTQICGKQAAGDNQQCKAMGGSPLQIVSNSETGCAFYVIGLTSFGNFNCPENPTFFTKVSSYVDWIESVVWPGESYDLDV